MWQTLESDPGLFTELLEKWGIKNVEFNEIFGVDPESFRILECDKIYGVIFLFNHSAKPIESKEPNYDRHAPVFFANQVVENSCASQALLGLTLSRKDIELSPELLEIRDFCEALDFHMRGEVIGGSEILRNYHNEMCAPVNFVEEQNQNYPKGAHQDAFHYVAFVPVNGNIYELDGLRPAPINHGPIGDGDTITKLSEILVERISQFASNQLGFSVMVASNDLRESPSHAADTRWQALQKQKRVRWYRENQIRHFQFTGLAIELLKQIA